MSETLSMKDDENIHRKFRLIVSKRLEFHVPHRMEGAGILSICHMSNT